tara:strand:- start:2387 stop:3868 length:1482 start_codon:yes stop_codon:yes gene_type:complete
MFKNLLNFLGDEDFIAGVATGAQKEMEKQEDRRQDDIRALRNFGLENGLRIRAENDESLKESAEAIEQLSSLVAGKRNINDVAVRETAVYMLDKFGSVPAALDAASALNTQYKTFGRDPISSLGFTDSTIPVRQDGATPTYSELAQKYTKLKPMPDLSAAQIDSVNEMTALDRIFSRKGIVETAQESVSAALGDDPTQTQRAFKPLEGFNLDEEMILGDNLNGELLRMHSLKTSLDSIPEAKRGDDHEIKMTAIANNINMLSMAKAKTKDKTQMTINERKSFSDRFAGLTQQATGYDGQYDPTYNTWIPTHKQTEIVQKAQSAGSKLSEILDRSFQLGLKGRDGEGNEVDALLFIEEGANINRMVEIVPAQFDKETGAEISPAYLTYGEKILDVNKVSAGSGIPNSPTSNVVNPAQSPTGTSSLATSASNYTPSAAVQASLQGFKTASNAQTKQAEARAIMAALTANPNLPNQAARDAVFQQLTGMTFQDSQK